MTTVVHSFFRDHQELKAVLEKSNEISLLQTAEDSLRKSIALAAGSYFEYEISNLLAQFAANKSNNCAELVGFIKNKALNRQYHSLFNWDARNANTFFGLFGEEFKKLAQEDVKKFQSLNDSVKSFLELGELRNMVAHQNFASFATDKTSDEIFSSFKIALEFLEYLKKKLI